MRASKHKECFVWFGVKYENLYIKRICQKKRELKKQKVYSKKGGGDPMMFYYPREVTNFCTRSTQY